MIVFTIAAPSSMVTSTLYFYTRVTSTLGLCGISGVGTSASKQFTRSDFVPVVNLPTL